MHDSPHMLVRLEDDGPTLADPADDVRGRKVVDRNGSEVGDINGLIIDEEERRVRILEIDSAAVQGSARTTRLVPIDVIGVLDDHIVHISPDRMKVASSPVYDPDVVSVTRGRAACRES